MEAFKVRLIQEYNELNERIGKLSNFLKNPNGVELSEKMMAVMGGQQVAMEEYSRKLWERMEMLGITSEDVQRLIETIRYNTGTLEQLRREYSMMRKDSQSTR